MMFAKGWGMGIGEGITQPVPPQQVYWYFPTHGLHVFACWHCLRRCWLLLTAVVQRKRKRKVWHMHTDMCA